MGLGSMVGVIVGVRVAVKVGVGVGVGIEVGGDVSLITTGISVPVLTGWHDDISRMMRTSVPILFDKLVIIDSIALSP